MHKTTLFSLLVGVMLSLLKIATCENRLPKIAVIGGGIGGTSCAYFLRQLFGDEAKIAVYERDTIGGRLNLMHVDGQYYEAGGSVIHPRNKYMIDFANLLGLQHRKPYPEAKLGLYDGKDFVFEESNWSFINLARLYWRYGFSIFQMSKDVTLMLDDFSRIYDLQIKELAFTTVHGMLEYMNPAFPNMTQQTISTILERKGYSKQLISELVQSIMMVNYGQTNNISGFAGFVSLAGADQNLFSISGGNKLLAEGLLKFSKAKPMDGDVQEVELLPDGTLTLRYAETSNGRNSSENYDIVILCAPLISGSKNIEFVNFKKDFHHYEMPFQRTVATFVKGELNSEAFNVKSVPEEVLTFNPDLTFNSIGNIYPVKESIRESNVYKVFSKGPLTHSDIKRLFGKVEVVKEKDWLAYPHYHPPENLPPFLLYPGLYYTNAIELSASAMEMSAIAAKNTALLSFNLWNNLVDKVNHHKRTYRDEL